MRRKALRLTAFIVAVGMIIGLGFFANGLLGNPVSKTLARRTAENYVADKYADTDFYIDHVSYDFKSGGYSAYIKSLSSIDTHFSLYLGMDGRLQRDDYNSVLNGWNTYQRLSTAYRELTDSVFENPFFPDHCELAYGDLELYGNDYAIGEETKPYGLKMEELEVDQLYDIQQLGAEFGRLTVHMSDETLTAEQVGKKMLEIKQAMDAGGAPFYAIDFVLQPPKQEDEGLWSEKQVEVVNFLYEDIYEEGLTERVREAIRVAEEYRKEQDALKLQEKIE